MMNTVIYSNRSLAATNSASYVSAQVLQAIVESIDGAMILTKTGELVASSFNARQICTQFTQQLTQNLSRAPQKIWNCCQSLIEDQLKSIDEEVKTDQAVAIRIRAFWLASGYGEQPHLLVMLEDQHQANEYRAKTEARKYGLTERETQVWLLKRTGHSYKSIAAQLYIAEDTVKKHIKAIHAKREVVEFE
jgi:DNA-binding CsgD family transcriptional regulator